MSDHAIYAPSSAKGWLKCPAGPRIARNLPRRDSQQSSLGTHNHSLLETAILTKSVDHILDDRSPAVEEILEFVDKFKDARLNTLVSQALAHEGGDTRGSVEQILEFVEKLGPGTVWAERRVTLSELCWGTADLFHLTPCETVLTIGDYKNGAWDVEAVGNEQEMTYGGAALREFTKVQWFRFVIFQPNSRSVGEVEPIKQWVASRAQVEAHVRAVENAIARGEAGEPPRPGDHCRWCNAFGHCEATRETLDLIKTAIQMPPAQIPDHAIAQVARVLRGLGDYKKLVDSELNARLLTGRQVPSAQLEPMRGVRQWRDEFTAKKELLEAYGPHAFALPTPAAAEKLGSVGKEVAARLARKPPGRLTASY